MKLDMNGNITQLSPGPHVRGLSCTLSASTRGDEGYILVVNGKLGRLPSRIIVPDIILDGRRHSIMIFYDLPFP